MHNKFSIAASELASGAWFIDSQAGLMNFRQLLEHGAPVDSVARPPERQMHFVSLDRQHRSLLLSDVPDDAGLLVIRQQGILYSWEATWIEMELRWGAKRPEVLGAVLAVDCAGGLEHAAYRIYDAMLEFGKPITVYCDHGLLGSGAYLFSLPASKIIASRETDEIGSIGAYTTFQDQTKSLEKMGIVVQEIYAEQSTEKNFEYRQAKEGNFKPLTAQMTAKAARFVQLVEQHRPGVKAAQGHDPKKGGLFTADVAKEMGLIDEIGNLDLAIETTLALVTSDSSVSSPLNNTMFGHIKLPAMLAIKGVTAEQITSEQIAACNAELTAQGITGVAVVSQAEFTQALESANGAQALQTQLTGLNSQLTTKDTEITNLKTQLTAAQELAAQYGSQPGEKPTAPVSTGDAQPSEAQLTAKQVIDNLPHNKALDSNPLFNY
ncbi:S49 family peptidase [Tellurirhabdus bombi]|uniref:S49 family peptidase n=1 Tax=Tellurirhabdus bombi TaxID=2907205 RepID=UPI001F25F100|nr:S49 family peptidase [Tellurirhabdus bombi]